jgi:hypothetical protein
MRNDFPRTQEHANQTPQPDSGGGIARLSPKVTPGLIESMETLRADHAFIVIPQGQPYPLAKTITAIGLAEFLKTIP